MTPTKPLGNLLVIDDDEDVLTAAKMFLKRHADSVRTEQSPRALPTLLANESFDLILLDMNFEQDAGSGREGFHWLQKILEIDPVAVIILITAYGDVEMAVKAIKEGATDFVIKPWQNEKLLATLSAAMMIRRSRQQVDRLRLQQRLLSADLDRRFQGFIGHSPAMLSVFTTIEKVAKTDANVLILGENGTGKELVAREIHRQSARSDEVFLNVDMSALSEGLFESELFGHVKGAFTDAHEDRAGRFELASGGTLFLDEIGNLPLSLQAKLLTALQNRDVTRVGSNKSRPVDIRLVCASNMPLREMAAQKQFRQDLLYRINTVEISLPPLRERIEDIPLLVEHFLLLYSKRYHKPMPLMTPATLKHLETYSWPGNVRELQHSVERAIIMRESDTLQPSDFFLSSSGLHTTTSDAVAGSREEYNLEEIERNAINRVLSKHGGNISKTAKELGLTRAALYRRLEKYGL